ncbi:MAG: hypothetical protein E7222_10405 [Clostridiales bacterium]|uniref:hypothetical protein n=1 Tax=Aminipila sp. TaxID=2060095 RepID=UPI001D3A42EF|nr:hypothetical protein [Aminipila sp.]MBE6035090.1 hypothetical protein [Clostridiales bacterium]
MKTRYSSYIINKAISFIAFLLIYYIMGSWENNITLTLQSSILAVITIGMLGNILKGMIIGWFLADDISLKFNKKYNTTILSILALLSFYKFIYYLLLMDNSFGYFFIKAANYFQWILGIYIFLLVQYSIKKKKEALSNNGY